MMLSFLFLAMVVIGGIGSILGPVLGAVTISLLNLKLKGLKLADFEQIPLAGKGIATFCMSLDPRADEYVARIFGNSGYMVLDRVEQLPVKLPLLYMGLTR